MQTIKITRLIKVGDSLGVIVPKNILHALQWQRGDQVAFGVIEDNVLCIKKLTPDEIKIWKI